VSLHPDGPTNHDHQVYLSTTNQKPDLPANKSKGSAYHAQLHIVDKESNVKSL